jgi:carotenoid cleavage dioxygenase-like enzyme
VFVAAGEDDGYLMVYVTKPDGTSYMHAYDAATMDATPVAEVRVSL